MGKGLWGLRRVASGCSSCLSLDGAGHSMRELGPSCSINSPVLMANGPGLPQREWSSIGDGFEIAEISQRGSTWSDRSIRNECIVDLHAVHCPFERHGQEFY